MLNTIHPDIIYMQRCIDLALKGGIDTRSNPMVGAVLVYNNQIIGEGYHEKFGEAHAEINAFNAVSSENKSLIRKATLYVSLEPCSHQGKTPPCALRIVEEGIKKVVIGCEDPNPLVAGKGIQYLKNHGIEITYPVLKDKAVSLISKFKANLQGYPHIILKWAQSADLYVSKKESQTWLSNEYSRILAHKWRSETDGIMVGKNTAMMDDPALDVRYYEGASPIRILMDTNLSVDMNKKIIENGLPTIIMNQIKEANENHLTYLRVDDIFKLSEVLNKLYKAGITSVLVEGGALLLNSFIKNRLWHEARVIKTNILLKDGVPAPGVDGRLISKYSVHDNEILHIENSNPFSHD